MFTATAHSRPLILLLRGSLLSPVATVTDCTSAEPVISTADVPEQLPLEDTLYRHTTGDIYLYQRTDLGKRLCIPGLHTRSI